MAEVTVHLVGCPTRVCDAVPSARIAEHPDWRELLELPDPGVAVLGPDVASPERAAQSLGRSTQHEMILCVPPRSLTRTRERLMITPYVPIGMRIVSATNLDALREAVHASTLRVAVSTATRRKDARDPRLGAAAASDAPLAAFHRIFEQHEDQIDATMMDAAARDPGLAAMMAHPAAEADVVAARHARRRDALARGDWEAFLADVRVQGTEYARSGLPYANAFGLHPVYRRAILEAASSADRAELERVALGMGEFLDKVAITIGEAYLAEHEIARTKEETARERLIEALRRSNEDLEQFAYVSSHDLQEPLRMVIAHLRMLERVCGPDLNDKGREYLRHAVEGAGRMKTLVNDLLTYARVDALAEDPDWCDLAAVLADVREDLAGAIEDSGAVITADALPRVWGDRSQLGAVLANLVGNAIKFRGDRAPRVQIAAAETDAGWRISVRDDGVGFDPAFRDRLFVMFQTLHHRDEFGGSGIGLSIVKRVVERHGGRVWADSAPGRGACFTFTLPHPKEGETR